MIDRVILIILDSVGIGEMPDAEKFGDKGSNTIGNVAKSMNGLKIPNMIKLGIGNIQGAENLNLCNNPLGSYGRLAEKSIGKDTVTGHWEIAGVILETPLNTYPKGFPKEIIKNFEEEIGRKTLGNKVASGTEIIKELGDEHRKTGFPIVYTSADSVFQIAADEDVIPLDSLYEMCKVARKILVGENIVGRVIARPFKKINGVFTRTSNRRDYALDPFEKTMLQYLTENRLNVMAVGKIEDIYNKKGITEAVHTSGNEDGINKTLEYIKLNKKGLIFTNLVDFDMLYGHRNDPIGYGRALEEFDRRLPEIIGGMNEGDVLIITADHGCDPTTESTDHSREYVPLLVYGSKIKQNINLGTRECFCDIGKTILHFFNIENKLKGDSFKDLVIK